MRLLTWVLAALSVGAAVPTVLVAQAAPGDSSAVVRAAPVRRQKMERQLRQGIWRITKERVQLSDDQMRQLESTTAQYDARRRTLTLEERQQRQVLRTELVAGDRANQDRVGATLDRLLQLQRQRLDVMSEEQKALAKFMTPVQRAKYAAIEEQLHRRVENVRRNRGAGGPKR